MFIPFLFLYCVIVALFHTDAMQGDEDYYYTFARNLLQRFHAPQNELNLWSGPGYPIFLMPFVFLDLPLITITLFNALFQYMSVVFLYSVLVIYTTTKRAFVFSVFWACYYVAYQEMYSIYTESFTIFLISLILYFSIKAFNEDKLLSINFLLSGCLIGFLVLTKIIFGYVLLFLILSYLIYTLIKRNSYTKKALLILVVALAVNVPYLAYTYNSTNKLFYWGTSGGNILYWSSTPFEGEFGDWNNDTFTANCGNSEYIPCNAELFKKNHATDFEEINKYSGVERDDAFKRIALKNIKENPLKYLKNCVLNVGRLFFGIPVSYFYQTPTSLLRIPPNSLILFFLLFNIFISILNIKKLKFEIIFLATVLLVYLGLSITVSASPRQLSVVVPIIILWTAYSAQQSVKLKLIWKKTFDDFAASD